MRKKFLVDKNFQFRTTFYVLGSILIFFAVFVGGAGVYLSCNNNVLKKSMNLLENTVVDQQHIISGLQRYGDFSKVEDRRIVSKIISNNLKENNLQMNKTMLSMLTLVSNNGLFLAVIIFFMLFQSILLFFLLVKKTHSISGPVYVMTNQIKNILNGKDEEIRPLRQNDEFKELYSLLGKLTDEYNRALGKNL